MHATISDIVLDCFQNSVEAGAKKIMLSIQERLDRLTVIIDDDGCGMSEEQLKKCSDPYYTQLNKHRNRKVGLGLPFLFQMVEQTDGSIELQSNPGVGTRLSFSIDSKNLDMPPLGDLTVMLLSCFIFDGGYEVVFDRTYESISLGEISYQISRKELLEILGNFENSETIYLLKSYIKSQEEEIIKE